MDRAYYRCLIAAILLFSIDFAAAAPVVDMSDVFGGSVANASGQYPTTGSHPWACSGADAALCVRGAGQLTATGGASSLYYIMQTSHTPFEVIEEFTDSVEAPNGLISILLDDANYGFNDMWHVGVQNSGGHSIFGQLHWCDTHGGCSPSVTGATPQRTATSGGCPAMVTNHAYRLRVVLYTASDTAVATLEDVATGDILCENTSYDPTLSDVIGPWFYLESSGSPHIVFTSVAANDYPGLGSPDFNYARFTQGIDGTTIGGNVPFTGFFNDLHAKSFTTDWNSSFSVAPAMTGTPGGELDLPAATGGYGSKLKLINGYGNSADFYLDGGVTASLRFNGTDFLTFSDYPTLTLTIPELLILTGVPTTDPHVTGAVWSNAGVLMIDP